MTSGPEHAGDPDLPVRPGVDREAPGLSGPRGAEHRGLTQPAQPSRLRSCGTRPSSARARWLIESFSAAVSCAEGALVPSGRKIGSYPNPLSPGALARCAAHLAQRDPLGAIRQGERRRAHEPGGESLVRGVRELREHSSRFALSSPCRPDQRADRMPGIPLSASTARPESSATAGSPSPRSDGVRLEQRVVGERLARLGHVGDRGRVGEVVDPEHVDREARVGEDPAQLHDLVRVAGRQQQRAHVDSASTCSRGQVGAPRGRQVQQLVEQRRGRTGPPRQCPAPR